MLLQLVIVLDKAIKLLLLLQLVIMQDNSDKEIEQLQLDQDVV